MLPLGCFSVLSFLSEKEKKEPKKRNLNGEGDARKPSGSPPQKRNPNGEGFARKLSGSPPRSFARVGGGERSFFSFGKRAKEPKKRKPIGVGDARKPSGSPPRSVRFPSIGRPPRLALPIFPCGAFLSEKPRKIFFTNERTRRRRAGAAGQPKRVPELSFWFFFFHRKKKNEKILRKEKRTNQNKTDRNSGRLRGRGGCGTIGKNAGRAGGAGNGGK